MSKKWTMSSKDTNTLAAVLFFITGFIQIFLVVNSDQRSKRLVFASLAITFICVAIAILMSKEKSGTSQGTDQKDIN